MALLFLLTPNRSVICIDAKSENAKIAGRTRETFGSVHILDPLGAHIRTASMLPKTLARADTLVHDDPRTAAEAHWNEEARALIADLILHIVTHEPGNR
ncbi:hypothetical protein ABFT80_25790 [Mesorhizobium sp. SB112]|uniref:hypothetical protein n=1 Tax=Mesorhizobium sp. SB112 TaxID=3151853 RepID=UPI0032637063